MIDSQIFDLMSLFPDGAIKSFHAGNCCDLVSEDKCLPCIYAATPVHRSIATPVHRRVNGGGEHAITKLLGEQVIHPVPTLFSVTYSLK